ncbi:MAG: 1-(5-phosphoribosyl)-5-[(5-phosphoribosylamino)methylideneamino]imidazole-4-carboxamide isomerase [Gemmatimonadaceae bacterium]
MLAIPALDLREGCCVQLVEGDYKRESIRLDDPLEVARRWVAAGFSRLHVVDLDGATGRGDNRGMIRELLRTAAVPLQVGGGVRDEDAILSMLKGGVDAVVVGTRAVEDPAWLSAQARLNPDRVILAADVRARRVVTRGWSATTSRDIVEVASGLREVPLRALLVTAVHMEGLMQGVDLPLMEAVVDAAPCPVIASGGVSDIADLRRLRDCGVSAVVIGMALYSGTLDPRAVAEEFAA